LEHLIGWRQRLFKKLVTTVQLIVIKSSENKFFLQTWLILEQYLLVWSLGITAIELADGRPPFAEIHPMRAIFMIPIKPSATVRHPQMFSKEFNDFVAKCLIKDPHQRVNSSDLLQNDLFIKNAKPSSILCDIIDLSIRERNRFQQENSEGEGKIIILIY